jgi:sulfoxide reductase catalytic subunit YedY
MGLLPGCERDLSAADIPENGEFTNVAPWTGPVAEEVSRWDVVTNHNNFYEFGTGKEDPARNAHTLVTDPWSVEVTGEADRVGTYTLEDILRPHALEERIYRMRCVEGWSLVIPWTGFSLGDLLSRFEPRSSAKFVQFFTLADRDQMPGLRRAVLDWPYREGLTIEEAMHPLAIMVVGIYGRILPNQNGAPLRLVVPWKYGFKGVKSIVRIHFTDEPPRITTESPREGGWSWTTSWNESQANEYGFFANVNPDVAHPRWSQATELRIDGTLFPERIPTLMLNGFAEEVAHLYRDMDLEASY